jgi:diaminopimelate epimerase
MKIEFWKYQGNGNDFIILDERDSTRQLTTEQLRRLCDRNFGIGADGLMTLAASEVSDFKMVYYNADGKPASMCGNGGRCVALFAYLEKIAAQSMHFEAYDGIHKAIIEEEFIKGKKFAVSLQMADVTGVEQSGKFFFLDTGSPHYVEFVENLAEIDVEKEGRKTRYSERFSPDGTNVNFVELKNSRLFVRTYERGVEAETLSCGTGVTATAIAAFLETGQKNLPIRTSGGEFKVKFEEHNGVFSSLWLYGPAEAVFKGTIAVD